MLKIGEFSKVAKTTIKTLRFYDREGLFKPQKIDENGYRYYGIEQLHTLLYIVELRKLGLSVKDVRLILEGKHKQEILSAHLQKLYLQKKTTEDNILTLQNMLCKGVSMREYKIIEKTVPDYNVYYRHGTIPTMDELFNFVLEAGEEVRKYNPQLECEEYCFITYTAKEYRQTNVELEYVEAVKSPVRESENIKSKFLRGGKFVTVAHKGSYSELSQAYAFVLEYVQTNGLTINGDLREVYIDGCWNKDDENDYLTEIQVPIA